jgi:hypothetical protein
VEWVDEFKYLGTTTSFSGGIVQELNIRAAKAVGRFAQLRPILLNRSVSLRTRMLFYRAFIPASLIYGCESWALTTAQGEWLNARHMHFLRAMLGITLWDRVENTEVLRRCSILSIQDSISRYRMRWLGHLVRMDTGRLPRQIFQGGLPPLSDGKSGRGVGKPATTIAAGYRRDVGVMGLSDVDRERRGPVVPNFWSYAEDRGAWHSLVRETWATHAS